MEDTPAKTNNQRPLSLDKLVIYFTLYSVIGWVYEVFLEVVVYGWGFTNRGVLFGPYCPVYGFGALAFLLIAYPIIKNKPMGKRLLYIPVIFFVCMLIATSLELATSYILEILTGAWPWQTYADYKVNFQARIALSPSIRFGLGGVLFLYILQPLFERITDRLGARRRRILAITLLAILAMDLAHLVMA